MTAPTLPPMRDIKCSNCGFINRYRTVCQGCSKDLFCIYRKSEVKA